MRTQNLLSIIALPILLAATVAGCGSDGSKRVLTKRPSFLLGNAEWINPTNGQQEVELFPILKIRLSNDTDSCSDASDTNQYIELRATLPGSPIIPIGEGFIARGEGEKDCEIEYPVLRSLTPGLQYTAKLAPRADGQINFTQDGIRFTATTDASTVGMSVISNGWTATNISGDIDADNFSDMSDILIQALENSLVQAVFGSLGSLPTSSTLRIEFNNYPNPLYLSSDLWLVQITDYNDLVNRLASGGSVQVSDFRLVSGDNDLDLTGCDDAPLGRCIVREDVYMQYLSDNGFPPFPGTYASPSRVLILPPTNGGFESGKTYLIIASDQMESIQSVPMGQTWVKLVRFQ